MSGSVDELWTGSWSISADEARIPTRHLSQGGQALLQLARQPMSLIS